MELKKIDYAPMITSRFMFHVKVSKSKLDGFVFADSYDEALKIFLESNKDVVELKPTEDEYGLIDEDAPYILGIEKLKIPLGAKYSGRNFLVLAQKNDVPLKENGEMDLTGDEFIFFLQRTTPDEFYEKYRILTLPTYMPE